MVEPIETGDPKAKAKRDREKFESIEKIEVPRLLVKPGNRGGRKKLVAPELKSPDEQNPKWITDPEEVLALRKAKARAKRRDPKNEA